MSGLGFGLIGTGYMGRAHAIALRAVGTVFPEIEAPVCVAIADSDAGRARAAAAALGFERSTGRWQELLDDPRIDVIDVCSPNYLHHEMALAALRAGKHVYCEKPLGVTAAEAREMAAAAQAAGLCHGVGLNYICNPLVQVARDIVAGGELGEIVSFSGRYLEDYMSRPEDPFTWRCERRLAGAGALADLGSHLINMVQYVVGDIGRVFGSLCTVHTHRRDPADGRSRAVENEDVAHVLAELEGGVPATLDISRVATGFKCGLAFEICGTRGSVAFDQERMNELRLYEGGQAAGRQGFKTLLAGPDHPDYAFFCPGPGHGLGINDLKIIEVRNFIRSAVASRDAYPDFAEGLRVQQVMEAIEQSHAQGRWVSIAEAAK
jgi:predicted dehydrogenase